jgi:hypothetical protein
MWRWEPTSTTGVRWSGRGGERRRLSRQGRKFERLEFESWSMDISCIWCGKTF